MCLARAGPRARDGAVIDRRRSAVPHGSERGGEPQLRQPISGLEWVAVIQEHGGIVGLDAKRVGSGLEHVDVATGEDETLFGQSDGGRQKRRPRQRAVFFTGRFEPEHGPRHAGGEKPIQALLRNGIARRIEKHVPLGGLRRLLAEVDEGVLAVGKMNDHEAAAAEIAAARMSDRERVAHCDRRVDGVAAVSQDAGADFGCEVLRADDHAGGGFRGERCGRLRRAANQCADCDGETERDDAPSGSQGAARIQELLLGGAIGPSARSRLKPRASKARSDAAGESNSTATGTPLAESPAGSTRPGNPAVLPGAMLRATATSKGRLRPPPTVSVVSSPISGGGTRVAGKTMAATCARAKYSWKSRRSAGRCWSRAAA